MEFASTPRSNRNGKISKRQIWVGEKKLLQKLKPTVNGPHTTQNRKPAALEIDFACTVISGNDLPYKRHVSFVNKYNLDTLHKTCFIPCQLNVAFMGHREGKSADTSRRCRLPAATFVPQVFLSAPLQPTFTFLCYRS